MTFLRIRILALMAVLLFPAAPALAQYDQQQVINHSSATLERIQTDGNFAKRFPNDLAKAKAILIVPNLYKGGFLLGGQYGNGVLLAKLADGSWSYPAFYTLSGGSFGLQLGLEDVSIVFLINTDKALHAVLANQFKFGGDMGVTFAVVGAGMGASAASNGSVDIIAISMSGVGLYGGLSLEGTMLSPRESWNANYYNQNVSSRALVLDNAASNPDADKLRDRLTRQ
jgi:lipid-binding SYLF domain-containing protein